MAGLEALLAGFNQVYPDSSMLSLCALEKEPRLLTFAGEELKEKMDKLAVQHYKTFLQNAQGVSYMKKSMADMSGLVGVLTGCLPEFAESVKASKVQSLEIRKEMRTAKVMLQNQVQLLELLELPQLMETCVRQQLYDEALNLEQFAQSLLDKYPNILILSKISLEMKGILNFLKNQLLHDLSLQLQLPQCLRLMGYLRRLEVFSEEELQKEFLIRRDVYLDSQISSLPTVQNSMSIPNNSHASFTSSFSYMSKLIDIIRVHLFDIVTHFWASFSSESGVSTTPLQNVLHGKNGGYLCIWLTKRLNRFMSLINSHLDEIHESSFLFSLYEQIVYCTASLARVGFDFSFLIYPVFRKRILELFSKRNSESLASFATAFSQYQWCVDDAIIEKLGISSNDNTSEFEPPNSLLSFPSLAILANGLITGFNELRSFATISQLNLAGDVLALVKAYYVEAARILRHVDVNESTKDSKQKIELTCHFIPYFHKCLNSLLCQETFPMSDISSLFADMLSVVDFKSFETSKENFEF